MKRNSVVRALAALAIVVAAGGVYSYLTNRATPPGQAPLAQVDRQVFEDFRTEFNLALGHVRVIALLSPT